MRKYLLLLIAVTCLGRERRRSAEECAAIARYNDRARNEIRGQKAGELEPECKPARKAPPKKR